MPTAELDRATLPDHVVRNPRTLAVLLAEGDMPGRRSMTAIERLRIDRARRNQPAPTPPSLEERALERLLSAVRSEIWRRGGETSIQDKTTAAHLAVLDRDRPSRMVLAGAAGWRYYGSRAPSRYTELAYLYGVDDNGAWAVRVPGATASIAEALAYITPAAVKKARAKGLRVWRQGDVYAIETTARFDGSGASEIRPTHEWRPATRYLVHHPEDGRRHRPLRLPVPVRFVQQSVLAMGRVNGRTDGD